MNTPALTTNSPTATLATTTSTAPAPRWPAWARVVATPLLLFVPMVLLVPIQIAVVSVLPDTPTVSIIVRIALQAVVLALTLGLLTLYLRLVERRPLSFTGLVFTRWSLLALGVGIAASALVQAVAMAVIPSGSLRPTDFVGEGVPVALLVVLALTQSFLLQGIPEEVLFRGYLVKTLAHRPWVAITTSVVLFAAIHLVSNGGQNSPLEFVLYLLPPFGFALSAVGLALLTKSLWAAIGVHAGFHLSWMAAAAFFGVGDGPAMWVAKGLTHTLIGVIALVLWSRRGTTIEYTR